MSDRFDELAEIWFKKANGDLDWAKETLTDKRFGGVCFLGQQAAEKTLKAYLFFRKQKLIRTHNLPLLNEKCKKFDPDFSQLDNAVDTLNNYYVDTRYPDIWDYTRFENEKLADEAVKLAEQIIKTVKSKLKVSG